MVPMKTTSRLFSFLGGRTGPWRVEAMRCVVGDPMALVPRLAVASGSAEPASGDAAWVLQGVTSNERYVTREEKAALVRQQEGLGRPAAQCAALIAIRKRPPGGS